MMNENISSQKSKKPSLQFETGFFYANNWNVMLLGSLFVVGSLWPNFMLAKSQLTSETPNDTKYKDGYKQYYL